MNQKVIKEYIKALEHMTSFFKSLIEEENKQHEEPTDEIEKLSEFTNLRLLARSNKWPSAIEPDLICEEDEDSKLAFAEGILTSLVNSDIIESKFLDFGCGEGHTTYLAAALNNAKLAVGYDITNQNWNHFEETPNLIFSNEFSVVQNNGPYNVILLNDVLDHCQSPENILKQLKSIKTEDGKIHIRCHPWTSRHGTHLYKQLNKAYLHLVFSEDELRIMGLIGEEIYKTKDPLAEYRTMFLNAGFKILSENIKTQSAEMFFTHEPAVLRRIKSNWSSTEFQRDILEIQFIDFVLN